MSDILKQPIEWDRYAEDRLSSELGSIIKNS